MKKLNLSKINEFLSEKKNKGVIYVILIIGIVLLCLPSFFPEREESLHTESKFNFPQISQEIEKILSEIEGVGKCEVMVTYKSSKEYVTAKDKSIGNGSSEEKNLVIGSGSSESPFVIKEEMPQVLGVVVVCEGGGNTEIKNNVSEAVCALCGINRSRVKVFKK